jgi:thiopurine S-methyltransferase
VLVPLCGKTIDLDWLARQGHEVTGVELSALAAEQFHAEQGRQAEVTEEGPYTVHRSEHLRYLVGDVFDLPSTGHTFDLIWDRAATVALPPELRSRYAKVLREVGSGGVLLLVTFAYDEAVLTGPPFSVDAEAVRQLHPEAVLLDEADLIDRFPHFRERGHDRWLRQVWQAELP